jgi:hypothetical protein
MNRPFEARSELPPEQEAIRDKCFHPSGAFVEFPIEDVETSIPARFEKMVRLYPNHLASKIADQAATYAEINAFIGLRQHSIPDANITMRAAEYGLSTRFMNDRKRS